MYCAQRLFRVCILSVFLVFPTSFSGAQSPEESSHISFVVAPDVLANYQDFMKGRHLQEVMDIDARLPRDTLEVFITLYSLQLGGLEFQAEFISTPSLERHISLLRSGTVSMSAALIDKLDLQSVEGITSVPAFFDERPRLAGLFTAPGNERALSATTRDDIKALTAISNKSWRADWAALQNIELVRLVSVSDWTAMTRMVLAGRVDFLLAPRQSNHSGELQTPAGPLVQMRPFAVEIHAHRQFAISEKHADADLLRAALEKGKAAIGPQHFINDAIRQAAPAEPPTEILLILNK